jgi:hypothetical protein
MNAQSPTPVATFDEMRRILRELPGPDLAAQTEVVRRQPDGSWLFLIDNPRGAD